MINAYKERIQSDCQCSSSEAVCIENVMRVFVLQSTLDWLSATQFRTAARKARRLSYANKAVFDEHFAAIRAQFLKDRQGRA